MSIVRKLSYAAVVWAGTNLAVDFDAKAQGMVPDNVRPPAHSQDVTPEAERRQLGPRVVDAPIIQYGHCDETDKVEDFLSTVHKEEPHSMGITNAGKLLKIFTSKQNKTWTVQRQSPEGRSCTVSYGGYPQERSREIGSVWRGVMFHDKRPTGQILEIHKGRDDKWAAVVKSRVMPPKIVEGGRDWRVINPSGAVQKVEPLI